MLFVYVTLPASQVAEPAAIEALIERLDLLRGPFLELHPSARIQFIPFAEEELVNQVRRRTRDGLGPDLMLVDSHAALELHRRGLSRPAQAPEELLDQIDPAALRRLRLEDGSLAGLPLLLHTEQACFNRKLVPQSPPDLEALLRTSATGVPVGLSLEPRQLAWLLGGFGADRAIAAAMEGEAPDAREREDIRQMLQWLADANLQERMALLPGEEALLSRFAAGELGWIPCRSSELARLRQNLGDALGVAGLPRGPRGEATPVNSLRVWVLGRNSSPRQRDAAERWAAFTTNPVLQRRLILESTGSLPVNRRLPLPVESSAVLRTLEETRRQAGNNPVAETVQRIDQRRLAAVRRIINDVAYQVIEPHRAADDLLDVLRPETGHGKR